MGVVRGRWKRGGERARSTVTVAHSGKLIILSSKMMIFLWDRGKGEREICKLEEKNYFEKKSIF